MVREGGLDDVRKGCYRVEGAKWVWSSSLERKGWLDKADGRQLVLSRCLAPTTNKSKQRVKTR